MKWPTQRWARRALWWGAGAAVLATVQGAAWLSTGQRPWEAAWGLGAWSAVGLVGAFLGLLEGVKWLLRFEWAPLAVARALLDEALRMRLAVVFLLVLLLIVVGLPFTQDPSGPCKYRVQFFLTYSLGAATFLLSLLSIFLSCGSLSGEIEDKRIFTVMAKPVGRGAYLLGKWLGVVLLNSALLAVTGGGVYVLTRHLEAQAAREAARPDLPPDTAASRNRDLRALRNDVLTARTAVRPRTPEDLDARAQALLAETERADPKYVQETGREAVLERLREGEQMRWRSVAPGGRQTFVFEGLQETRRPDEPDEKVRLRYKFEAARLLEEGAVRLRFIFNEHEVWRLARPRVYEDLWFPAAWLGEDGSLTLTVIHDDPAGPRVSILFPPGEGLEVLYPSGSFAGNLARGLLIIWVKLGFLAALGLSAATFLHFPVASLAALVVYAAAEAGAFLQDSLRHFEGNIHVDVLEKTGVFFGWVGEVLAFLFQAYGRFEAVGPLVDGRLIPWNQVAGCAGWIGVLWSGLAGVLAWLIFRRRELGRVQV